MRDVIHASKLTLLFFVVMLTFQQARTGSDLNGSGENQSPSIHQLSRENEKYATKILGAVGRSLKKPSMVFTYSLAGSGIGTFVGNIYVHGDIPKAFLNTVMVAALYSYLIFKRHWYSRLNSYLPRFTQERLDRILAGRESISAKILHRGGTLLPYFLSIFMFQVPVQSLIVGVSNVELLTSPQIDLTVFVEQISYTGYTIALPMTLTVASWDGLIAKYLADGRDFADRVFAATYATRFAGVSLLYGASFIEGPFAQMAKDILFLYGATGVTAFIMQEHYSDILANPAQKSKHALANVSKAFQLVCRRIFQRNK